MTKQTVIIGMLHESVNNIYQIPPRQTLADTDVVVHHNPSLRIVGDEFSVNADIVAHFPNSDGLEDTYFKSALKDNYHVIRRYRKSEQVAKIIGTKSTSTYPLIKELEFPDILAASDSAHSGAYTKTHLDELGASLGPSGESQCRVVVKPENGAKGMGQVVVSVNELRYLLEHLKNGASLGNLKQLFPGAIFSETENNDLDQPLSPLKEWTVGELIDDITAEYRIILGGNKVYCVERTRKSKTYTQANLDLNTQIDTGNYVALYESDKFYRLALEIADLFDLRVGSIDLYERANGEIGFFECCPQFGLWSVPHDIAAKVHLGFVEWLLATYHGTATTTNDTHTPPKHYPNKVKIEMNGYFITLEGPDAAGKSTMGHVLKTALENLGHTVILTSDYTATPYGAVVRDQVVNNDTLSATSQMLALFSLRYNHVEQVIKPALDAGNVVICDRFNDSTYAYQVNNQGAGRHLFRVLENELEKEVKPDATFLFDVTARVALDRVGERGDGDRFDDRYLKTQENFETLQQAFDERLIEDPDRFIRVDASRSMKKVKREIKRWAQYTDLAIRDEPTSSYYVAAFLNGLLPHINFLRKHF